MRKWYTDGIKSKVYEEGTQPVGWKLGRIQTSERKKRKPLTEEQKRKISETTKKAMANMTEEKKNEMNSNRNAAMAKLLETEEYHQHLREGAKKAKESYNYYEVRKQNGRTSFLGKHHSEETKQKISQTKLSEEWKLAHPYTEEWRRKLGQVPHPGYEMTDEIRKKMSESHSRALAGGKCKSRYCIDKIYFDSSWEALFYLYCRENGKTIERGIAFKLPSGKHYICDFKIDGELIEVKSPHFYNENGELYNPYNDELYSEKDEFIKNNNVKVITDIKLYLDWCNSYYCKDFVKLFKVNSPFPYEDSPIWHCHKKGKLSPWDAWNNMELRQKAIENRLLWGPFGKNEKDNWKDGQFKPKHSRIEPSDIVQAFSIAGIAPKVSVLRESRVWLPEGTKTVVNPFSGFGAVIKYCKKNNIDVKGYDIQNICGEDIIIQDLTDNNFEDKTNYDCLFCCPPYSDKEEWTVEMPKIMNCDEWIDLCLKKFPNCKKYIFIVDESKKYKYADIEITNNSHFGKASSKEHYVVI